MVLGDILALVRETGFDMTAVQAAVEPPLLENFVAAKRSAFDVAAYSFQIMKHRWPKAEQLLPREAAKRGYPDCVTTYALIWNQPDVYEWADKALAGVAVDTVVWKTHMERYYKEKARHSQNPENHFPWDVEWVPED